MKVVFTALEFLLKQGKTVSIKGLGSFHPVKQGPRIFVKFEYDPNVETSPELIKIIAKGGIGVQTAQNIIEKEIQEIIKTLENQSVDVGTLGTLIKKGNVIEFNQVTPLITIEHSFLPHAKELPVIERPRRSGFSWFKLFLVMMFLGLAGLLAWQFYEYDVSWKVLLGLEKPTVDTPSLDPHFVDSMINVMLQQMEDSLMATLDSLEADTIPDSLLSQTDSLSTDSIGITDTTRVSETDTLQKESEDYNKPASVKEPEFIYYIIVGSYPDSQSAQNHVNKLRKQGYNSAVVLKSKGRWRVAVDTAHNKASLSTKLTRYKKEIRRDAWSLKSKNVFGTQ